MVPIGKYIIHHTKYTILIVVVLTLSSVYQVICTNMVPSNRTINCITQLYLAYSCLSFWSLCVCIICTDDLIIWMDYWILLLPLATKLIAGPVYKEEMIWCQWFTYIMECFLTKLNKWHLKRTSRRPSVDSTGWNMAHNL